MSMLKTLEPSLFPINMALVNWRQTLENHLKGKGHLVKYGYVIRKAFEFCDQKEASYPWVCEMLEMGHHWYDVAQKMISAHSP